MTALDESPVSATPANPADPRFDAFLPEPGTGVRRASLAVLLLATAVAYLWTLSESGYANSFYSAAVQAGSQSWTAFFFGSLDIGNSITVDKPPAALWLMGLSVRLFGLSSWSILVPQALLGVATVSVVWATVRRISGHWAGIVAGAATALTPAAALMFRFNNPDALLVFLLAAAGYCTLRGTEAARGRWLVLAGVLVGFGFLTKMLQALVVLPVFALIYLLAAPTSVRRRLLHLLAAGGAMLVSGGWWVAIAELVPTSLRPYVDGSQNDSVLELVFGYNGVSRLTGSDAGGLGNAGFGSPAGLLRLFQGVSGGMVSWLLPAALILLVAGVALRGRAPRTDRTRAALLLFGGTMLTTGLVFSFMAGIYHDYYTVALTPWIAGTALIGFVTVWRERHRFVARLILAFAIAVSTGWASYLLSQSGERPYTDLRWVVIVLGALAAALLLVERLSGRLAMGALLATVLAVLLGPASYTANTIATPHTGSIVTAGPYQGSMSGGPGGRFGPGGDGGFPGGAIPPQGGTLRGSPPPQGGLPPQGAPGGTAGGPTGGTDGGGGLFGGTDVTREVAALLSEDADSYTWVAASTGAQSAANYQLATGESVMAIGGFNGTTPSPTLEEFQGFVADGEIHYYLSGGRGGPGGGRAGESSTSEIEEWVAANFATTEVGGVSVYDLTSPLSGSDDSGTRGATQA